MLKRIGRTLHSRAVAFGGVGLIPIAWMIDAAVDVLFFELNGSYWDALFHPDGHEIWMRGFIAFLLIVLGLIAAALLKSHETAEQQHALNQALLEKSANDLGDKNLALKREIERRKAVEQRLAELATTDPLTGIYNRRKFDETLQDEVKRESRYKRGLALIILDIDHFKRINDDFGHAIGERAREADRFFRIGGEEFALLTGTASNEELTDAAERLRQAVEAHDFGLEQKVTISLGASHFLPGDNCASLFKRTDEGLYQAKGEGRNRVVLL